LPAFLFAWLLRNDDKAGRLFPGQGFLQIGRQKRVFGSYDRIAGAWPGYPEKRRLCAVQSKRAVFWRHFEDRCPVLI